MRLGVHLVNLGALGRVLCVVGMISIRIVDDLYQKDLVLALPCLVVLNEVLDDFAGQFSVFVLRDGRRAQELYVTRVHLAEILEHLDWHWNARVIRVYLHLSDNLLVVCRSARHSVD